MTEHDSEWYWDLRLRRAVPAPDRGPADHQLGPYPTRSDAENWQATVEARNEAWDDDDEEWDRWGVDPPPSPSTG